MPAYGLARKEVWEEERRVERLAGEWAGVVRGEPRADRIALVGVPVARDHRVGHHLLRDRAHKGCRDHRVLVIA